MLSMVIARRLFGDGVVRWNGAMAMPLALAAAIAVWIGTPLLLHDIAPPMSHAVFGVCDGAVRAGVAAGEERWSLRGLIALGALAALLAMVREQDVFIAIGPAIDWLVMFVRRTRARRLWCGVMREGGATWFDDPRLVNAAAGVVAFVIAYTPQLMAYMALNGYSGSVAPRRAQDDLDVAAWAGSARLDGARAAVVDAALRCCRSRGWSCLVFASWRWRWWTMAIPHGQGHDYDRDRSLIGICLMLMVATQVYVAGCVESWTVAGAFGQRRFVGLSAIFAVGLVASRARDA